MKNVIHVFILLIFIVGMVIPRTVVVQDGKEILLDGKGFSARVWVGHDNVRVNTHFEGKDIPVGGKEIFIDEKGDQIAIIRCLSVDTDKGEAKVEIYLEKNLIISRDRILNNGWYRFHRVKFADNMTVFYPTDTTVTLILEPGDVIASQYSEHGEAVLSYAVARGDKIKLAVVFKGYEHLAHGHRREYSMGWTDVELSVGDEIVIGTPFKVKREGALGYRLYIKFKKKDGVKAVFEVKEFR